MRVKSTSGSAAAKRAQTSAVTAPMVDGVPCSPDRGEVQPDVLVHQRVAEPRRVASGDHVVRELVARRGVAAARRVEHVDHRRHVDARPTRRTRPPRWSPRARWPTGSCWRASPPARARAGRRPGAAGRSARRAPAPRTRPRRRRRRTSPPACGPARRRPHPTPQRRRTRRRASRRSASIAWAARTPVVDVSTTWVTRRSADRDDLARHRLRHRAVGEAAHDHVGPAGEVGHRLRPPSRPAAPDRGRRRRTPRRECPVATRFSHSARPMLPRPTNPTTARAAGVAHDAGVPLGPDLLDRPAGAEPGRCRRSTRSPGRSARRSRRR